MAVSLFYNGYAALNAVVLSDHVESIKLEHKADMLEKTAMSMDTHQFIAGLKDWNVEIVFFQDYAASSVDVTLNALIGVAAFTMDLRPDAGAPSATNPRYSGTGVIPGAAIALLEVHQPISGGVGTLQKVNSKLRPAGTLNRQIT